MTHAIIKTKRDWEMFKRSTENRLADAPFKENIRGDFKFPCLVVCAVSKGPVEFLIEYLVFNVKELAKTV